MWTLFNVPYLRTEVIFVWTLFNVPYLRTEKNVKFSGGGEIGGNDDDDDDDDFGNGYVGRRNDGRNYGSIDRCMYTYLAAFAKLPL